VGGWTTEARAEFRKKADNLACQQYQARKRRQVIEKLGGKCSNCGETDPDLLQIDEHDKTLTWSKRYGAILRGEATPALLCAQCNWKKRKVMGEDSGRPSKCLFMPP
jgi:hypothetical protein